MRLCTLPLLFAGALLLPRQGGSPAPAELRAPLVTLGERLATAGLAEEVARLALLLEELGAPAADARRQANAWRKTAEEVKRPAKGSALKRQSEAVRRVARDLEAQLARLEDPARGRLARVVLALDEERPEAHEALEHAREEKGWVTPVEEQRRERMARLAQKLERARAVEVPIEVGPSSEPVLSAAYGARAVQIEAPGLELHTNAPAEEVVPLVREVVRAFHYSEAVRTGSLRPPRPNSFVRMVLLAERAEFLPYAQRLVEARHLSREGLDLVRQGFQYLRDARRNVVGGWSERGGFQARALYELWIKDVGSNVQPSLTAGHLNLVCLEFFQHPCPPVFATYGGQAARTTTGDAPARGIDRAATAWRGVPNGPAGVRDELVELARDGADPPWLDALRPETGVITGRDRLKCSAVVEFLIEEGRFARVLKDSRSGRRGPEPIVEALGEDLGSFERRWRVWLLAEPSGMAQRLDVRSRRR